MFPKYEFRDHAIHISAHHCHTDCPVRFHRQLEILWILSGQMEVSIGGKRYTLGENDLYLVFPNVLHCVHQSDASILLIIADSSLFPQYSDLLSHNIPENPVLRYQKQPEILSAVFRRIIQLRQQEEFPHRQSMLTGYIGTILGELLAVMKLAERTSDNDLVQKLILYILNNYTQDITLEQVARELNYSKCYISHLIADTFQCNFRALINAYRVSLAKNLLQSSSKAVGEIAYACGFRNQSSFNRIFMESCGVTPNQFRKASHEAFEEKPTICIR